MTITICDKCGKRIKDKHYLIEAKLIPKDTTPPTVEYLDVCVTCWLAMKRRLDICDRI